jgi:hypothetical protein
MAVTLFQDSVMPARGEPTAATSAIRQTGEDSVSFFTKKVQLWTGRPQMICFQIAQPATEDRFFSFQIDDKAAHVLIPPQILKGEKIGYLRVQPLKEGRTQIGVGGAMIDVTIAHDAATREMDELHAQIVSPASGSTVWGAFAVGVEQLTYGDPTQLPVPTLRLPNGTELTGHVVPNQKISPHARWVFTVNAGDLAPGGNKLVVVSKDETGQEIEGTPIYVEAIRPSPEAIIAGSCTAGLAGDRPANDGPPPPVVNDDKYGQGKVVNNSNDGAPWCLPVWITQPGVYQMMVTTRGDIGGDALPSLALTVDDGMAADSGGTSDHAGRGWTFYQRADAEWFLRSAG